MVDSKSMKVGDLSDDDWDKVIESTEAVANSPLYIEENSSVTISELRSIARKWKQNYGVQVIMIDYLQLMSLPCRGEPAAVYRGGFPCIEELGEGTEDSNYCIVAAFPCGRCKTGPQASAFGFASLDLSNRMPMWLCLFIETNITIRRQRQNRRPRRSSLPSSVVVRRAASIFVGLENIRSSQIRRSIIKGNLWREAGSKKTDGESI